MSRTRRSGRGKPSRKRKLIELGFVALAALGLLCVGLLVVLRQQGLLSLISLAPKWTSAEIVPADTVFFAAVSPDVRDIRGYRHLIDVYDATLDEAEAPVEWLETIEREWALSFADDFGSWIGPEVAIAVAGDASQSELNPVEGSSVVFVASTRDGNAAEEFLSRLQQRSVDNGYSVSQRTYRDISYSVREAAAGERGPFVSAQVGGYVLLANGEGVVRDVIDVWGGDRASLGSTEEYNKVVDALPRRASAIAFYDAQHEDCQTGSEGAPFPSSLSKSTCFGDVRRVAVAISTRVEGVRIDLAATHNTDTRDRWEVEEGDGTLLQKVPDDVAAFFSDRDLGASLAGRFAKPYHLSALFEEKLLERVDGEFVVCFVKSIGGDSPRGPEWYALFEPRERQPLIAAVETFAQNYTDRSSLELDFGTRAIGNVVIRAVVDRHSGDVALGYGVVGDLVIVGASEESLGRAVDSPAHSIAQDEVFNRVRRYLPAHNGGYLYLNTEVARNLIRMQLPDEESIAPYLEPIKALGAARSTEGTREGVTRSSIFVYIP